MLQNYCVKVEMKLDLTKFNAYGEFFSKFVTH